MRILFISNLKKVHFDFFYDSLNQKGHEIHVIGSGPSYADYENIAIHRPMPFTKIRKINKGLADFFAKKQLQQIISQVKPDILHVINIDENMFSKFLSDVSIPTVVTPVGSDLFRIPWQCHRNFQRISEILRATDFVLTRSMYAKSYAMNCFKTEKKTFQVNWGIDLEKINHVKNSMRREEVHKKWGLGPDDFVIVLPRGMRDVFRPAINFFTIVDELIKRYANAKVVVFMCGDAPFEKTIRQMVGESKSKGSIFMTNKKVSHEEMLSLFSVSDMVVSLAESDEMCVAILEAMYLGNIPVISDLAIYGDNFKSGVDYLAASNIDPFGLLGTISYGIDNYNELSHSMPDSSSKVIKKKYDRKKCLPKLVEFYESVVLSSD